ncbi:period circadian protein isoform X2 [Toxorhynchites rutilus septentrionalis]|uniref:period circadian protein isoform X2 n=1 Tax=Toxorhynchites rutilus septentrionalis TaxID=329112 RepID=UPI00247AB62F|nr:period circadian protein isoform X2 [Toxorhynchites rutilus septentrionalis]
MWQETESWRHIKFIVTLKSAKRYHRYSSRFANRMMENSEGTESTHNTKISDSGYSYSCSNSQSQRSGSSKSRHSNWSGTSGFNGKGSALPDGTTATPQPPAKRIKDKNRKRKLKNSADSVVVNESELTCISDVTDGQDEGKISIHVSSAADQQEAPQSPMEAANVVTATIENQDHAVEEDQSPIDQSEIHQSIRIPITPPRLSPSRCTGLSPKENHEPEVEVSIREQLGGSITPATPKPNNKEGFYCVITEYDSVVLYTTPGITHCIGFPKDMWLGRSFLDFVHPNDRASFARQITSKVSIPVGECNQKNQKNSLYASLRKYRGLRSSGFGVTKTAVSYEPYRLVLTYHEAPTGYNEFITNTGKNNLLIISATPIKSVYTAPNEQLNEKELKFSTRHTNAGILSYVDESSVESTGYLPQDILGRSIMELYHPEDMPLLKKIYETVMLKGQTAGVSFVSEPYRFLVKNGDYVVLKTEWTSFVNPCSRELEFVVGRHQIIEGPANPDVFSSPYCWQNTYSFPRELLKKAKSIEEQILRLLNGLVAKPLCTVKQDFLTHCKAIASFMEELVEKVTQSEGKNNALNESEFTFSERVSVMLGEISPHHDYFESKSSSDTSPSYNQLNYNDNLQRFFDTHPVMNIKETFKIDSSGSTSTGTIEDQANASPNQKFWASGEGSGSSAGNVSSESNNQMDITRNIPNNIKNLSDGFQLPTLTEQMLSKHNEDMQNVMLKRHRKMRSMARGTEKNKKGPLNKAHAKLAHGVKRSSAHSWEGDVHKTVKHQHSPNTSGDCQLQLPPPQPQIPLKPSSSQPTVTMESCASAVYSSAVSVLNRLPSMLQTYTIPHNAWFHTTQSSTICTIPHNAHTSMANRAVSKSSRKDPRMNSNFQHEYMRKGRSSGQRTSSEIIDDTNESSFSSFYSSFLDTDSSSGRTPVLDPSELIWDTVGSHPVLKNRRTDPPWFDNVCQTEELIYQYQLGEKSVNNLLESDLAALKKLNQPILVNDQLEQLYVDLESRCLSAKLSLGESTSSSSSDGCDNQNKARIVKRNHKYSRLVWIYEDNAPLPPPDVNK